MNQKGFVAITLLIFVPVFLGLSFALSGLGVVFFAQKKAGIVCREEMLEAQRFAAEPLNHLLALNHYAEELHLAKEITDKLSAIVMIPWLKLILTLSNIALDEVKVAFRTYQLLVFGYLQASAFHLLDVAPKLSLQFSDHGPRIDAITAHSPLPWPPRLKEKKLDKILSTYHTPEDFEKKQKRNLRWTLHLEKLIPINLRWLQIRKLEVQGVCASTLKQVENKKGEKVWKQALTTADKSSWSWSSAQQP